LAACSIVLVQELNDENFEREVLQAALRQDPALDDAHEDDERGGGEPEAGPKA